MKHSCSNASVISKRDLEEQAQRSALLLKAPTEVVPKDSPSPVELDLSKIPQYEEYV